MTAKPRGAKPPIRISVNPDAPAVVDEERPASVSVLQDWEHRKAALRFAIDCGAKTTDIVPVAAKIEEYIRNGQAKPS